MKHIIALLLAAFSFASQAAESTATPVSATFTTTSSSTVYPNPDRGFYDWAGADMITDWNAANLVNSRNAGYRLIQCSVDLLSYRTVDIPGSLLTTLQSRFDDVRAAGMKCAMWFRYDAGGSGNDATAAQIAVHAAQLGPVVKANADVIAAARAGFYGAWGEWHDSLNGNNTDAARLSIRDSVLGMYHKYTPVGFRNPAHFMLWFPSVLPASRAFTGSTQSRVGFHNDCLLGSNSDVGTFSSEAQRTYAASLTEYTSSGPHETCGVSGGGTAGQIRVGCSASSGIMFDGPRFHLNILNATYDTAVNSTWSSGGCYNQVAGYLGYRLQLDSISHQGSVTAGDSVTFNVLARNIGWARFMFPRRLQVVLTKGGTTLTANANVDMRQLPSQATKSSKIPIRYTVPIGTSTGSWTVHLKLPDFWSATAANAYYAVRFQNADATGQTWDATNARLSTNTTLTVN
jgi:hypothetical protein